MLINEERDEVDDQPDHPGCFERCFQKMGIGHERYNQILVFIQVSVPLLIGLGIIIGVLLWIRTESFSKFILWVQDLGAWGYVILAFAVFLCNFPWMAGYSVIAILSGFLFGWWGIAVLIVGDFYGFLASFLLVRYFLRDWFEKKMEQWDYLQAARSVIHQYPIKIIFLLRVGPVVVGISTALIAITKIDLLTYIWVSMLGHLPKGLMYIFFGHYTATSLAEIIQGKIKADAAHIVPLVFQILVFLLLILLLGYYGKKALADIKAEKIPTVDGSFTDEDNKEIHSIDEIIVTECLEGSDVPLKLEDEDPFGEDSLKSLRNVVSQ